VRPGLVMLGVAFVVIGVGSIAAVNLLMTTTTQVVPANGSGPLPAHRSIDFLLGGPTLSSGVFTIRWYASGPVSVVLSAARCDAKGGNCTALDPLVRWDASVLGHWTTQGSLRYPMVLVLTNPGTTTVDFGFSASGTATTTTGQSTLVLGFVDAAGGALTAVGAVAIFLGFFLRPHPYEAPPPPVSRSADDVSRIAEPPAAQDRDVPPGSI
jgi:hypothetical protein